MKNWFIIFILSLSALLLAGTAAYFSVFGLTQLFYGAGIGITILAASLEFAKVVTVSYVYRFWKNIERGLRFFYIFAVLFIMFLTSMGIYGFLISGYQKSANKIELRDSQIRIANSKRTLFTNQLDRTNKSIESSTQRINTLSGLRNQQEKRLDNLLNQKYMTVAKRTESQISGSDEQIKLLNNDITDKMKQTNIINDSISFYDQKIAELKASEVSNEISSYQFISDLTGIAMNRVVNLVALVIIFVFDPLAIALLIAVNRLTMNTKVEESETLSLFTRIRNRFKKKINTEPLPIEPKVEEEFIDQNFLLPKVEKIEETIIEDSIVTKEVEKLEEPTIEKSVITEEVKQIELIDIMLSGDTSNPGTWSIIHPKNPIGYFEDIHDPFTKYVGAEKGVFYLFEWIMQEEPKKLIQKIQHPIEENIMENIVFFLDDTKANEDLIINENIKPLEVINIELNKPVESHEISASAVKKEKIEEIVEVKQEPTYTIKPVVNYYQPEKEVNNVDNEFEPKKIASISGRVNVAHFIPKE